MNQSTRDTLVAGMIQAGIEIDKLIGMGAWLGLGWLVSSARGMIEAGANGCCLAVATVLFAFPAVTSVGLLLLDKLVIRRQLTARVTGSEQAGPPKSVHRGVNIDWIGYATYVSLALAVLCVVIQAIRIIK